MSTSYVVILIILLIVGTACIISDKKAKTKKEAEKQALSDRLETIENRLKTLETYNDIIDVDNNEE